MAKFLALCYTNDMETREKYARELSKSPLTRSDVFWRQLALCPHGRECQACCWEWQAARWRGSYGIFSWRGHRIRAHRYAFLLAYGTLPPRLHICHRCDNPPCCNPAHLFSGTPQDNMRDAQQKGRLSEGERHTSSRLTLRQVQQIRQDFQDGIAMRDIVQSTDMSFATVWNIVHGKSWKATHAPSALPRPIRHRLTPEMVRAIRAAATAPGATWRSIAQSLGISHTVVGKVLRGKRHADVL